MNRRIILCTLALLVSGASASAQSVHNASQASALSGAGLSAAVAFVPLSVTIGGSAMVSMTAEHLSRLLSQETTWIVEQVKGTGPRTELTLRATRQPAVMIVGLPTTQVTTHNVVVNNQVRFEQLAPQSFALKHGDKTLGVMAPERSEVPHSKKK